MALRGFRGVRFSCIVINRANIYNYIYLFFRTKTPPVSSANFHKSHNSTRHQEKALGVSCLSQYQLAKGLPLGTLIRNNISSNYYVSYTCLCIVGSLCKVSFSSIQRS